jgi:hypothetical protein
MNERKLQFLKMEKLPINPMVSLHQNMIFMTKVTYDYCPIIVIQIYLNLSHCHSFDHNLDYMIGQTHPWVVPLGTTSRNG